MTRYSLILGAAILAGAAYPHLSISAPLRDGGPAEFLLAQAPPPTPAERERERERQNRPPGQPPNQRPAQGAPGAAPEHQPGAAPQRPGGAPATQAVPGTPPARGQAQTPPTQQQRTPPVQAQTPPVQPVRPGAPAAQQNAVPPAPGTQRPAAGVVAPVVPPPVRAQTPPVQPVRPGAPAAQQNAVPPAPGTQRPAGVVAPVVAPPVQAQTPPVQPGRPGAPAVQQNTVPPVPGTQRPAVGVVAPVVPPPVQAQTPPPVRPGAPAVQQNTVPPVPGTQRPAVGVVAPVVPPPAQAQTPPPVRPGAPAAPGVPAAANAPVDPRTLPQHLDQLRGQRQETQEGNRTVIREGDRTIIREGGRDIIRHDEAGLFRYNAREVNVERRGNLSVTVVVRPDGSRIVTETDPDGRLIRRLRRDAFGREVIIIDNSFAPPRGPGYAGFFVALPPPVVRVPRELYIRDMARATAADIALTLMAPPVNRIERRYGLDEIRYSEPLRARMPRVDIDTVNFETGSWEIAPDQAQRLASVAQGIMGAVQRNPSEVFLIEGYTDAVGNDVDNLSLSDRRAEAVAAMLTSQFGVPAENLSTQGYGKQFLKVPTDGPERANRRVAVRRITPLLTGQN